MYAVTLGPFAPICSLVTWTTISWPFLRSSWMGLLSLRRLVVVLAPGLRGSIPLTSETCRKAFFGRPMSTNAAWKLRSTLLTRPL